jgi:hypothetical protein
MMSPNREYSRLSLARQIDTFWMEADHFERDVHILILSTLDAAKSRLDEELTEDSAKISKLLDKATGDYAEHLSDQLAEINLYFADQERFLLNMAVVALASRLTHSLRQMSRSAETFSPREKRQYAGGDKSEFERLWIEFKERFGFEVRDEVEHVSFIEPLREVRNQIVHEGGLANPYKQFKDVGLSIGDSVDSGAFNFDDLLD